MNNNIINGKQISQEIKNQVKEEIQFNNYNPQITVFLIGNNEPSKIYIRNKKKQCEDVGIRFNLIHLCDDESQEYIENKIRSVNNDPNIHGLFIQLPVPQKYNLSSFIDLISVDKDIDGLTSDNVGKLCLREPVIRPCTSYGVLYLLKKIFEDLKGKTVCIVGSSNLVGRPLVLECLLAGCTVTVCHRFTENLKLHTSMADIVISAVGKKNLITEDMVKNDSVIIDVAIVRQENGKLCGDVDFENVKHKAKFITPVPGGVGPMTVSMLLLNVLTAYKINEKKKLKPIFDQSNKVNVNQIIKNV
tara:strand:- start:497 stop:1405 length:909 start_codon:yes stop_codon:yes gene_type:complete